MYKLIAALLLSMAATQGNAASCPAFHRFVDFGFIDNEGVLRRGGSIFRAFDTNNTPLLIPEETVCLDVPELAKDGRQLPVPVVSSIRIDPEIANLDLIEFRMRRSTDVLGVAQENARAHQAAAAIPENERLQSSNYLCIGQTQAENVSCQVLSPYDANVPLVIYCNADLCRMPAFARNDHVIMSATWKRGEARDLDVTGNEISNKIKSLFDFLTDHT